MLALNIPVAALCIKSISLRFTFYSMIQVFLASVFLKVLHFEALFDDVMLNVIFGGFLYGISIAIALRGNASTGGTDFIALYVSNKTGRSIWGYVFAGNVVILCIFGFLFGWVHAGYSILFQFISTRTISALHHRYDRVTLQVTTAQAEPCLLYTSKLVIIGPSGSGKSTFIRCINYLEEPTAGTISIAGTEVTRKNHLEMAKKYSSMVFQQFNLYPHLTVLENLTLAPIKLQHVPKAEAEAHALECLERVGLKEKAGNYPVQLSGGQQQRVATVSYTHLMTGYPLSPTPAVRLWCWTAYRETRPQRLWMHWKD